MKMLSNRDYALIVRILPEVQRLSDDSLRTRNLQRRAALLLRKLETKK